MYGAPCSSACANFWACKHIDGFVSVCLSCDLSVVLQRARGGGGDRVVGACMSFQEPLVVHKVASGLRTRCSQPQ